VRSAANRWLVVWGLLGLFSALQARAGEPIAPEQFSKLHTLIKPKAGEEKWTEIPWLTSLWEARQRAAKEGKPILLWEMDGHPLGCT
jgi:hypothetical protein